MSDLESPPNEYSIGAVPTTLKYVQYGRVTTKLDLADGENLLDNGFLRAPLIYKNDPNGVDHYFFRGVNATSIEQMAALPSDAVFQYSGHALMYGINNRFHGITGDANNVGGGHSLPNALGFDQAKMGLGNFVDATFNVGQKKVTGDVYNAWLQSLDKPTVLKDKLVHFQGDVIGNTIIGTADRAYIPGALLRLWATVLLYQRHCRVGLSPPRMRLRETRPDANRNPAQRSARTRSPFL